MSRFDYVRTLTWVTRTKSIQVHLFTYLLPNHIHCTLDLAVWKDRNDGRINNAKPLPATTFPAVPPPTTIKSYVFGLDAVLIKWQSGESRRYWSHLYHFYSLASELPGAKCVESRSTSCRASVHGSSEHRSVPNYRKFFQSVQWDGTTKSFCVELEL
jgi:hypothetical protein